MALDALPPAAMYGRIRMFVQRIRASSTPGIEPTQAIQTTSNTPLLLPTGPLKLMVALHHAGADLG